MKIVYDGSMDPRLCKSVLGETIPALAAEDPDFIYLDADTIINLDINELFDKLVDFIGVFFHKLSHSLAFDKVADNSPFTVNLFNLVDFRHIDSDFLNASLV